MSVAGFFIWERGLLGFSPTKISADLYNHLSASEAYREALAHKPEPLTQLQFSMNLTDLSFVFAHLRPND